MNIIKKIGLAFAFTTAAAVAACSALTYRTACDPTTDENGCITEYQPD